jgi:hypothetical protein
MGDTTAPEDSASCADANGHRISCQIFDMARKRFNPVF